MIGLATCADLPAEADESALEAALDAAGLAFEWAVWDDTTVDWARFTAVLIRTTWDYTARLGDFRAWTRLVNDVTTLFNPAPVVEWNSHKGYLLDLARHGVDVVPTVLIRPGDPRVAPDWPEVVVKPAVGIGSEDTNRLPANDPMVAAQVEALLADGRDALIQPFVPSIADAGETSVIFVEGHPTHAVRKVPASGDFRSQPEYGGVLTAVEPTLAQLALGRSALRATGALLGDAAVPVYARVDCVDIEGQPHLMELELIEPNLFVEFAPEAADLLVGAIARRLA